MKTPGHIAYESDVATRPTYHDGRPRRSWDQLDEIARWSWERPQIEVTEHSADDFEHVTL